MEEQLNTLESENQQFQDVNSKLFHSNQEYEKIQLEIIKSQTDDDPELEKNIQFNMEKEMLEKIEDERVGYENETAKVKKQHFKLQSEHQNLLNEFDKVYCSNKENTLKIQDYEENFGVIEKEDEFTTKAIPKLKISTINPNQKNAELIEKM